MPIEKHFAGHGGEVMASMKKTYGPEEAKRVFYATENKEKNEGKLPKRKEGTKHYARGKDAGRKRG